jgi:hypothetical protein
MERSDVRSGGESEKRELEMRIIKAVNAARCLSWFSKVCGIGNFWRISHSKISDFPTSRLKSIKFVSRDSPKLAGSRNSKINILRRVLRLHESNKFYAALRG